VNVTVGAVGSPESLEYEVVDVFAPWAFAGNPLAVVHDADTLTTEQCQALANEFNLSETSFLCAPTEPGADYKVRIFTPSVELPFAGHPSVGAAHTLVRSGRLPAGTLRQECGVGILDVLVDDAGATLTGGTPTLGEPHAPTALAAAVGLSHEDVTDVPARMAGCGLPFTYLAVRPDAVDRAAADRAALDALAVGEGISVLSWDEASTTAYARVFAGPLHWDEDPATGSAALGTGVWLVASGLLPGEGTSSYVVRQGERMGRPSVLSCTVTASGGAVVSATVQGAVVPIASGRIRVPA
jgi:trans-2,3-dihydro-3-hydroxyanthranilate isomerase